MKSILRMAIASLLISTIAALTFAIPVMADGGIAVPYDIWSQLKEGQQIAVVTINDESSARIDLFISIQDQTSESHEVVFFLPLGTDARDFLAVEKDLFSYNRETTFGLDSILRSGATKKFETLQVLFSGALLTNGGFLIPLWAPMLLSGCGAAEQLPEATYQTESSQISIYGIDENTDIQELINTTELHNSVQNTLSTLVGQDIAVIRLQTRPHITSGYSGYPSQGEPGIHFSWTASPVSTKAGPTYTYPLGTGTSWSKPIELTRVYVVAPPGMDFSITYPPLGSRQSGYDYIHGAYIAEYYQLAAYAVDEARGDFGRVWRVTYTQSNPSEDVIITVKPQSVWSSFKNTMAGSALIISLLFALVIGFACWFLSWHYLMPRFLGIKRDEGARLEWYFALIYPLINLLLIIFPGSLLLLLFLLGLTAPSLIALFVVLSGVSLGVFQLVHGGDQGVSRGRATRAFILVCLVSSGSYLLLSFGLAKLVGTV